ncbi:MAG: hypothetical protein Q6356_005400 [Candidatus Wukongarchaeota archaeon]|nr:hypothetical protein [Candidatus Wukongarchaeota archaeon]
MLSVISPSKFKEEHVQNLVQKMMKKTGFFRKKPLEDIIHKNMVWMPYYRIQFNYRRSEKNLIQRYGETGRSETVLNAMFCGCVKSEKELITLFRPNYLKHKIARHSPQSEEIVGSTFNIDFEGVLGSFLKRLKEVKDELNEFRPELSKIRKRLSRYSKILPMKDLIDKERKLSEKVARLEALRNVLNMCLNVNEDVRSIEVRGHDVFFYPILVVTLKHKENRVERYFIVDLVEKGSIRKHLSYDKGLTELCNKNSGCKETVIRSIKP